MYNGAYGLLIRLPRACRIKYGGRERDFKRGYYVYSGSAQGGLKGRLQRHFNDTKKSRWHVDELLARGEVVDCWTLLTNKKEEECELSELYDAWPGAEQVPRFGASDCRCSSHLTYFSSYPAQSIFADSVLGNIENIFNYLGNNYHDHTADNRMPFRTLISCILSLRTKDAVTDAATERLFNVYSTVEEFIQADPERIAGLIYPAGMYRQKAKRLIEIASVIKEKHGGDVPSDEEGLTSLPGVGRKTANLVRSFAFGLPAICVDTHVHRITNRWGLVRTRNPDETESELNRILPLRYWKSINPFLVQHGQQVCKPGRPLCGQCGLREMCYYRSLGDEAAVLAAINGAPDHPSLTFAVNR